MRCSEPAVCTTGRESPRPADEGDDALVLSGCVLSPGVLAPAQRLVALGQDAGDLLHRHAGARSDVLGTVSVSMYTVTMVIVATAYITSSPASVRSSPPTSR